MQRQGLTAKLTDSHDTSLVLGVSLQDAYQTFRTETGNRCSCSMIVVTAVALCTGLLAAESAADTVGANLAKFWH